MRVAPDADRYEWRKPVSPDEFHSSCRELLYVVEAPLGYARGRTQRLEGFVFNTQVRWNVAVLPLCDLMNEPCRLHNQGQITVQEFKRRREELASATQGLAEEKKRLGEILQTYRAAKDSLADPDSTVSGRQARAALDRAARDADEIIQRVAGLVRQLSPEEAPPAGGPAVASLSPPGTA